MSKVKMEIYTRETGVEMTLTWRNEEEFLLGKEFLEELLDGDFGFTSIQPGKIPFCYMRDEKQLQALFDFRRELRNRRNRSDEA